MPNFKQHMTEDEDEFLPIQALPELISLMELFMVTLKGQISNLEGTRDKKYWNTIVHLREDLKMYNENFEYWHQNASTSEEYRQLIELAKHLGEAKNIICKAHDLMKGHL